MNKVAVTGANGFVGSNVVRALLAEECQVVGLVRSSSNLRNIADLDLELRYVDIRERLSLEAPFQEVEAVIHTAALYRFWSPRPQDFYETNVRGTENVLSAAHSQGVKRVVITSTASLLTQNDGKQTLPEDSAEAVGLYKQTKLEAERLALKFERQTDLEVLIASPTVPIGKGDKGPTPTGRLILDFLKGQMRGYLEMYFNVVDVEDVALGHYLALKRGNSGTRYVLGNRNMKLSKLLWLAAKLTGKRAPRFKIPYPLAISAAAFDQLIEDKILGGEPTIPMDAVRSTACDERVYPPTGHPDLRLPRVPIVKALWKSISWFYANGYNEGGKEVRSE